MWFERVRRCKTVTFNNFCAITLATALEHHSANQFLKAATSLNSVQPKLELLVKMITVPPMARCPSFKILDDADVTFCISGAELRTVLTATTMLADSRTPQRTN